MIEYLKGTIAEKSENSMVLDVNGVGYGISVSGGTLSLLPGVGEEVKIYTYLSVREDGIGLYGFPSRDDLSMFKLLITVSGIGPKGALGILSALSPDDLRIAIITGDSKSITLAPGIGKKTAERIILDLKDKIDDKALIGDISNQESISTGVSRDGARDEAVAALVALGYSSADSIKAVREAAAALGEDAEADRLLKAALKVVL